MSIRHSENLLVCYSLLEYTQLATHVLTFCDSCSLTTFFCDLRFAFTYMLCELLLLLRFCAFITFCAFLLIFFFLCYTFSVPLSPFKRIGRTYTSTSIWICSNLFNSWLSSTSFNTFIRMDDLKFIYLEYGGYPYGSIFCIFKCQCVFFVYIKIFCADQEKNCLGVYLYTLTLFNFWEVNNFKMW